MVLWLTDHFNNRVIKALVIFFSSYRICNSKTLIASLVLPIFGDWYTRDLLIKSFMMMMITIRINTMIMMMNCFLEIICWQKFFKPYLQTESLSEVLLVKKYLYFICIKEQKIDTSCQRSMCSLLLHNSHLVKPKFIFCACSNTSGNDSVCK